MTKVTLKNKFHGTEVNVLIHNNGILSVGQTRRVRSELCGMSECCCGSVDTVQGDYEAIEYYRNDGKVVYQLTQQQ